MLWPFFSFCQAEQDARVFQSGVAVELCDCCSDETNTDVGHAVKIDVAKWYCLPCKKNLCPSCRIRHMNSESQTAHHLVESSARHNQQPPARQPNHCPTHPDRDIVVFCRDCSVVICEQCFTEQHGGHTWSDVETAAEEFRQRIQQDIDKVQEHLKMGQNRMRALEMQRKRLEDLDDIERIINLKSEELKALVDNDTNRLLMSLEEVKKRATDVPSDRLTAETPGEGSEEGLEEGQVLDGLQMLDLNDLIPINLTFTASQLGADDQNLIGRLVTLEESEIPPTGDISQSACSRLLLEIAYESDVRSKVVPGST